MELHKSLTESALLIAEENEGNKFRDHFSGLKRFKVGHLVVLEA